MEFFLLIVLLGLIPAAIANNKGRSFLGWWIYGSLLFIVALPHALVSEPKQEELEKRKLRRGHKKCPYCAELIKEEAVVCRYCGRDLQDDESDSDGGEDSSNSYNSSAVRTPPGSRPDNGSFPMLSWANLIAAVLLSVIVYLLMA